MTAERGSAMMNLVRVMDQLRSSGGCPWDASQTHESLAKYAIEEAYEVAEAAEQGDLDALKEELGDLLLQVVFNARVAQEHAETPFDIDDVIETLLAKLVRRHPHVFADTFADTPEQVAENWEKIKRSEKKRTFVTEGIPLALPALARAQKVISRARRAGVEPSELMTSHDLDIGERLLRLVVEAEQAGIQAEDSLRASLRTLEDDIRAIHP